MPNQSPVRLLILDNSQNSAEELVEHVLEQIKAFRGEADQSDDITMIAMKYLAKDGAD